MSWMKGKSVQTWRKNGGKKIGNPAAGKVTGVIGKKFLRTTGGRDRTGKGKAEP